MCSQKLVTMYDKIKFVYPTNQETSNSIENLVQKMENIQINTDFNTGSIKYYYGNFEGFKCNIFLGNITITGSLSKYFNPNNIYPLNRATTAQAIEKLSDGLGIDLKEAKVTELEFGTQFVMRKPVEVYLSKLGDMPYLERYQFNRETLYYKSKGKSQPKVLCFYDKGADAKAKGLQLPQGLEGTNLLRYELRYKGRLPKQFNCPVVNGSTLYEKEFYNSLVHRWQENYYSIQKYNQVKDDYMSEIKTVSDAFNGFVARLLSQSDKSVVEAYISELKANKVFGDRKSYTRLKDKIVEVANQSNISVTDEDIRELTDEVKNVGAYL